MKEKTTKNDATDTKEPKKVSKTSVKKEVTNSKVKASSIKKNEVVKDSPQSVSEVSNDDKKDKKGKKSNVMRIKLSSYDQRMLDKSAKDIVNLLSGIKAVFNGPILIPTKTTKYTVLRSPHVYKKSREQYQLSIHKRIIDIYNANAQVTNVLSKLEISNSIKISIKV